MLAIAEACYKKGHAITVFTRAWEGDTPSYVTVNLLEVSALTNHGRDAAFVEAFQAENTSCFDQVVGFNKMPGLDFYYAADSCFAEKAESGSALYRKLSRTQHHLAMEAAVFDRASKTKSLLISQPEMAVYKRHYQISREAAAKRLFLLPPGIRRDRVAPKDYKQRREAFRAEQEWREDEKIVLFIGSGFKTKGLDRAIAGFAQQSMASRLIVLGQDKPKAYKKQAKLLKLGGRVKFMGGIDNIQDYLWAADVLLHPAYRENTGTVLLEAMVAGLPVVTTDNCGYCSYVTQWEMGEVLYQPNGEDIANSLEKVLKVSRKMWLGLAQDFSEHADIYSLPQRAASTICGEVTSPEDMAPFTQQNTRKLIEDGKGL
jgi:UDP-glucose:(heptosyl)LPS alpha-1,3-glucosyltransferase